MNRFTQKDLGMSGNVLIDTDVILNVIRYHADLTTAQLIEYLPRPYKTDRILRLYYNSRLHSLQKRGLVKAIDTNPLRWRAVE